MKINVFRRLVELLCVVALSCTGSQLSAQIPQMPPMLESTRPQLPPELRLYAGTAPGSATDQQPEQWNTMDGYNTVRNVNIPTIIPILPEPGTATGAAVVILPGGGFLTLSMDTEGLMVAHELAKRGIAAFVLKYRLDPTPRTIPGFMESLRKRMAPMFDPASKGAPPLNEPLAVDDAEVALRLVRSRAAEWHIDPKRTGLIGFSAGAMTTLTLTLENRPGGRPSFVGIIYGPMLAVTVPPNAPPLFAALASDDRLFGKEGLGLVESWQKAGSPVELHFYQHGDHGFGMRTLGTTSDLWFEEFFTWLKDGKFLLPKT